MYKIFFKRFFDILLSLLILFFLSPILVLIFLCVWLKIGFPIYLQKRPGFKGRIFVLYKFKTLYDISKKTSEKKRQNKLGNFLRKTGLDELPQLINVLENNMSLVGPRPLLVDYLKKYKSFEKKRHSVKPGITGLAQVNPQKSGLKSWRKSIQFDIEYTKKISFFLDIQILFKTLKIVLLKKKQYQDFKKSI